MILFQVRNPIARVFLILVPLIIFAVMYFTVIKPSSDTANDAVRTTTQAVTQQLDQAKADTAAATKQASDAAGSTATKQVADDASATAQKSLDDASKLTDCVAKAGADTGALADCQANFGG
jgi:F0F1-type ATP synthase membrane subunit b/b'